MAKHRKTELPVPREFLAKMDGHEREEKKIHEDDQMVQLLKHLQKYEEHKALTWFMLDCFYSSMVALKVEI